jgi:hypothetical protein
MAPFSARKAKTSIVVAVTVTGTLEKETKIGAGRGPEKQEKKEQTKKKGVVALGGKDAEDMNLYMITRGIMAVKEALEEVEVWIGTYPLEEGKRATKLTTIIEAPTIPHTEKTTLGVAYPLIMFIELATLVGVAGTLGIMRAATLTVTTTGTLSASRENSVGSKLLLMNTASEIQKSTLQLLVILLIKTSIAIRKAILVERLIPRHFPRTLGPVSFCLIIIACRGHPIIRTNTLA